MLVAGLFMTIVFSSFSQKPETLAMLKEIDGQWTISEKGTVDYVRIVVVPELSMEKIYERVIPYFTYDDYNDMPVIQSKEKEEGLIIGKGIFHNAYEYKMGGYNRRVDVSYTMRVDYKEGKARIKIMLTNYDTFLLDGGTWHDFVTIARTYPLTERCPLKDYHAATFYNAHKLVLAKITDIEKAIKEGNGLQPIPDEW